MAVEPTDDIRRQIEEEIRQTPPALTLGLLLNEIDAEKETVIATIEDMERDGVVNHDILLWPRDGQLPSD